MMNVTETDETTRPNDPAGRLQALVRRFRSWRHHREWEYGNAGPGMDRARRHRKNGNVQFVLWKAGEQGHTEDWWCNMDSSWWRTFRPETPNFEVSGLAPQKGDK